MLYHNEYAKPKSIKDNQFQFTGNNQSKAPN